MQDTPRARAEPRVALVTGASRGLGRAGAIALARQGFRVVATARSVDDLNQTVARFEGTPGGGLAVCADIATSDGRGAIREQLLKAGGALSVFLHCASAQSDPETDADLESTGEETIDSLAATTVAATFHLTKELVPMLERANGAHVIFVVSDWALRGSHGPPVFSASKAAVGQFAHTLRRSLAHKNVQVTALYPGDIATYDVNWAEPKWDIDDPVEDVVRELGSTRIPLMEMVETIQFIVSRRYVRVEEMHLAPTDPEYDY